MPPSAAPKVEPDAPSHADVFLSPRVVDAAAFEQFAGALRALVGQASAQDEALRARLSRSETVLQQLAKADAEPHADTAQVLGRVEELQARVDRVLARPSPAAPAALDSLDGVIEQGLAAAESRLAALVEQGVGRIQAAATEARATVCEASEGARADIEHARSVVHAARAEYDESLAMWRERMVPLTEQAALETANLEARLRAVEDRIASVAAPLVKSLSVLGGRAAVLLGRDPEEGAGPAAPGSLADLVARAERLAESARFAMGQLESIRADAEHTQASLTSTLDASAATIDHLARRQQELGGALLETVRTTEAAREALDSRARRFLDTIEGRATATPSDQ